MGGKQWRCLWAVYTQYDIGLFQNLPLRAKTVKTRPRMPRTRSKTNRFKHSPSGRYTIADRYGQQATSFVRTLNWATAELERWGHFLDYEVVPYEEFEEITDTVSVTKCTV